MTCVADGTRWGVWGLPSCQRERYVYILSLGLLLQVELCLESVAHGAPLFRDESSRYHHESCWRKPFVTLAIIELGFHVVCLDVDIVAFKPILPAIDWTQDLMAASDCNREEHNLTVGKGSPDSGVVFAKASPATSKFMHKWLASRGKPA